MKHTSFPRRPGRAVRTAAVGLGALFVAAGAIAGTPQAVQAADAAPSSSGPAAVVGSTIGQSTGYSQGARILRYSAKVKQAQTDLATLGYVLNYGPDIDGLKGRRTNQAIRLFKKDRCLTKPGERGNARIDAAFLRELRRMIKLVQTKAGMTGREVDGYGGPNTIEHIMDYQRAHRPLDVDGQAGPKTMAKMGIKRTLSCGRPR